MLLVYSLAHTLRRLVIILAEYILDSVCSCDDLHVGEHADAIAQSYQILEVSLIYLYAEYAIGVEETRYFPAYFSASAFN